MTDFQAGQRGWFYATDTHLRLSASQHLAAFALNAAGDQHLGLK